MSTKAINVYDFDHTIYNGDASLDFIIYCLRHKPSVWKYLPAQAMILLRYSFGLANRKQVKEVSFAFLREIDNLDIYLENFWNAHVKKIKPWYLDQKNSSDLVISASPEFLLKPITKLLGISPPIATIMNTLTGEIIGENCRASEKVHRLHQFDPTIAIRNCYSDGRSDMPLLSLADNAFVVKKHVVVPLAHDSIVEDAHVLEENQMTSKQTTQTRKALLRELFLYGLIGGSTALLDVVLFKVFRVGGIPLLAANFMSVSIAVGSSFILNAKYNFKKTDNLTKRALSFFFIGYFGWFVQSIILWTGVDHIGYDETFVKMFAVFVAAAIQYILNKFLTFRN